MVCVYTVMCVHAYVCVCVCIMYIIVCVCVCVCVCMCAGTPETYGNLLVWDSIMPRFKATYDEIKREQRAYR